MLTVAVVRKEVLPAQPQLQHLERRLAHQAQRARGAMVAGDPIAGRGAQVHAAARVEVAFDAEARRVARKCEVRRRIIEAALLTELLVLPVELIASDAADDPAQVGKRLLAVQDELAPQ
eukprot:2210090-Prymnesium_polylepis.1